MACCGDAPAECDGHPWHFHRHRYMRGQPRGPMGSQQYSNGTIADRADPERVRAGPTGDFR